jgi:hypothetical protein
MADRAIIRISAIPDSDLRRALTGTVDGMRKASRQVASEEARARKASEQGAKKAAESQAREAKKAADATVREAKRAANEAERAVAKSAAAQEREVKRAEQEKRREIERTLRSAEKAARGQEREAAKTARAQIREAEKSSRAQQRLAKDVSDARKGIGLAAGGAVLGAGNAALGQVRGFQSAFGVKSSEEKLADAIAFKRRAILVGDMANLAPKEREGVEQRVLATSARTGVSADQLLAGLERAQDKFSDLRGFTKILDDLANISVATGASVEDVVGSMGVMRRQLRLTDDEMLELGGAMVQAADLGNISFNDLSSNFAAALGALGRSGGLRGMEGAKKALAIAQTLGASDMGAAESATRATNLMTAFNKIDVQKAVRKRFNVDLTEGGKIGGKLRDLPTVIQELAEKGFMDPTKGGARQLAFPDVQAKEAIEVLVTQFKDNPELTKQLLTLDPRVGAEAVKRRVAQMNAGTLGKASTMAARDFATFINSGEFDKFATTAVKSADSLAQLEAQYPLMTAAVKTTIGALQGFVGALLAHRLAFGAGGAGGGMGAFGATQGGAFGQAAGMTLGQSFSSSSFIGKLGIAGAAIGTGLSAYLATTAFLQATGIDKSIEALGARLHDIIYGGPTVTTTPGRGFVAETDADIAAEEAEQQRDEAIAEALAGGGMFGAEVWPVAPRARPARRRAGRFSTSPSTPIQFPLPMSRADTPAPPPFPGAEARLTIEVIGPGKVTSVSTVNTAVDLPNTGHRGMTP